MFSALRPPEQLASVEWADKYRFVAAGTSPFPGKYQSVLTPWVRGILEACDDPKYPKVVCMKSAQVAWTDGVMNNYLGKRIHIDPCPIIVMFPKQKSYERYNDQKLVPMIEATPVLAGVVDTSAKKNGNRKDFKKFPRGSLQLIASNKADDAKSTPAPVVAVEEPDDCNANISGQGDSIKLLEERAKAYPLHRKKILVGGTPTIKGFSSIEDEYAHSDQRKFFVPCHQCGKAHVLDFNNVTWIKDDNNQSERNGRHQPETAVYCCPECGCVWTFQQKNMNVRNAEKAGFGWKATAEECGVAGFHVTELYSPFPSSAFTYLAQRFLDAKKKAKAGDDADLMVFYTHALGLPYEVKGDTPEVDALAARAEEYAELSVPDGGLVLTAGVDVQHDRLAVIIRAWGKGEESWLVYWGELTGTVNDPESGVFLELEALLFQRFKHASGVELEISAVSVDTSDGTTNDAVYAWVRRVQGFGVMAIKGASKNQESQEIYTKPRPVDLEANTKASKYGLQVWMVGTHKAKQLFFGRLGLAGRGAGRLHFYDGVRPDYFRQINSEVLVPDRNTKRKVYQKKSGTRNEALDCEVYAIHAARVLGLNRFTSEKWDLLEKDIKQVDLFSEGAQQLPANKAPAKKRATGGFVKRGIN